MTTTDLSQLKKAMAEQLESKAVRGIIGWEAGSNRFRSRPVVFRTPDEVKAAIFSPACSIGLVRLLIEDNRSPMDGEDRRPLGIVLRGCDDKGVIELIKEFQTRREDLVIFGVDCPGMIDWNRVRKLMKEGIITGADLDAATLVWRDGSIAMIKGDGEERILDAGKIMLEKCVSCEGHTPRIHDIMIGEEDADRPAAPSFEEIIALEGKGSAERWEFWREGISRCIRCYACRNVCTYCFCEECAVDPRTQAISDKSLARDKAGRPQWTGQDSTAPSNTFYLLSRAYHGAGRCTSCEECDRACPMGIPLRLLNRKVRKDVKALFDYEAGKDPGDKPLLSESCENDPGDFIW